ncbi:MAG: methyltransferase domain-containing protein, partial [Nitriliruptoraceae bacterium]
MSRVPNPALLSHLACPRCAEPLQHVEARVACASAHSFDIARHGYLPLLVAGHATSGDDGAMVAARERLVASGVYAPVVEAVTREVLEAFDAGDAPPTADGPVLVDAGGGTGTATAAVLDARADAGGILLDLSRAAIQRAARAHRRMVAVRADVWRSWPVRSGIADVVLHVFSPRNPAEAVRVLRPGGHVVLATPRAGHQRELVGPLGLLRVDDNKADGIVDAFTDLCTLARRHQVDASWQLTRDQVVDLVRAGP